MISNREFKDCTYYDAMVERSDRKNLFDKYSIIKHFTENLTRGKSDLLELLEYEDEQRLQDLLEKIEDIEVNNELISIGNSNSGYWLKFIANEDGSFTFSRARMPLKYGKGTWC